MRPTISRFLWLALFLLACPLRAAPHQDSHFQSQALALSGFLTRRTIQLSRRDSFLALASVAEAFQQFAKAQDNPPAVPRLLPEEDVSNFIARHRELQDAVRRHPGHDDIVAQIYVLLQYFKKGGYSRYPVTNAGVSFELFYLSELDPLLAQISKNPNTSLQNNPLNFEQAAISAFHGYFSRELSDTAKASLYSQFVENPSAVTASPLAMMILVGGFVRHFELSSNVRLVMHAPKGGPKRIFLEVELAPGDDLYVHIDENESLQVLDALGLDRRQLKEPDFDSIHSFGIARELLGWKNHFAFLKGVAGLVPGVKQAGEVSHRISVTFLDLQFVKPVADFLAPLFLEKILQASKQASLSHGPITGAERLLAKAS